MEEGPLSRLAHFAEFRISDKFFVKIYFRLLWEEAQPSLAGWRFSI